ncbi:FAD dependent oxidoreductase [Erwinia amylovora Ea644]|uniref:NAD(P)/FAD-dependent oxidoreductase n=1 Tax=Erwinia amylovora TaxID=552 RepID=UPI0002CA801F|nr:FAD-binding oxidoreductase [Erwinia amylovora]CCP01583.1 FAD dependent oxidoreductase [Erwinia amylovora Ea644]
MPPCTAADVIVIGGGIVGACCAWTLATAGLEVTIIDAGLPCATSAGMGHLLILDDNPAECALTRYSLKRWKEISHLLPDAAAYRRNGTLWMAASEQEMAVAEQKYHLLRQLGENCALLNGEQLTQAEPAVRQGLAGGLLVNDDGILYAPVVAQWMSQHPRINNIRGRVVDLNEPYVVLDDGRQYRARHIVLANGIQATELSPELPLVPKKGHLLITDRYPHGITRTLVELGYVTSVHHATGPSAACNIQPRPTGQLLIGATRQFDSVDHAVEPWMLSKMVRRACEYVPAVKKMNAIRTWTGFRAASPDGLPLIGRYPGRSGLWLAVGHEGLGVTTATATADLIKADILQQHHPLEAGAYLPDRFLCGG